ncbi:MAG: hypothetical protein ACXQTZ_03510 [Candidatus Alkanophagales archaeon]
MDGFGADADGTLKRWRSVRGVLRAPFSLPSCWCRAASAGRSTPSAVASLPSSFRGVRADG